jgi:hypothetical protein
MKSKDNLCRILYISSVERVQAHYDGARTYLLIQLNSDKILSRTSHEEDLYFDYYKNEVVNGPTIYSSRGIFY